MVREQKPQIRVKLTSHRAATKAAERFSMTLGEYTEAALDYFTSRQLNPADDVAREGQLIMQQVKKLGDRIFAYMQEEERSLLVPMLEEMLRSRITLERVLRMNEILVNNLNGQLSLLNQGKLAAHREGLKKLRKQNEAAVERQLKDALTSAQQAGPGKKKEPGRSGKNEAEPTN